VPAGVGERFVDRRAAFAPCVFFCGPEGGEQP
jgi:hypothetical protein